MRLQIHPSVVKRVREHINRRNSERQIIKINYNHVTQNNTVNAINHNSVNLYSISVTPHNTREYQW